MLEECRRLRELSRGWFDPWAMPGGVDPTGYVKGWAAQCCLALLAPSGASGILVNAAGDLAAAGHPPGAAAWRIGIAEPSARAGWPPWSR